MGRISDLHIEIQEYMIKELKTKGYFNPRKVFAMFPFLNPNHLEDWETIVEIYSNLKDEEL